MPRKPTKPTKPSFNIFAADDSSAWLAKQPPLPDFRAEDLPVNQGFKFEPRPSDIVQVVAAAVQLIDHLPAEKTLPDRLATAATKEISTQINPDVLKSNQQQVLPPPPTVSRRPFAASPLHHTTSATLSVPPQLEELIESSIVKGDPHYKDIREAIINMPDLRPFLLCAYSMKEMKGEGFISSRAIPPKSNSMTMGYYNPGEQIIIINSNGIKSHGYQQLIDTLEHESIHCFNDGKKSIVSIPGGVIVDNPLYTKEFEKNRVALEQLFDELEYKASLTSKEQDTLAFIRKQYAATGNNELASELLARIEEVKPMLVHLPIKYYTTLEGIQESCLAMAEGDLTLKSQQQYRSIIDKLPENSLVVQSAPSAVLKRAATDYRTAHSITSHRRDSTSSTYPGKM